jgi:ABC-type Fe3+ transport system substrate-binding protein
MEENMLDSTILEIVTRYPDTLSIFINNGFAAFADEEALKELGAVLKLKTALRTKKIDIESFVRLLKDQIEDIASQNSLLSSVVVNKPGNFNFVAQLPCGLKVPLERELQRVLQEMQKDSGPLLNYYTGSCCNDLLNLDACIPHFQDIDEVPDLILTKGHRFFDKNFTDRFIKTGLYAPVANQPLSSSLDGFDFNGKESSYQVIALTTTIMVADRKRLGDLPAPRTWGDLLKPEYEGKVVMNMYGDSFSDVVLLNIYKEYGEAGIEALGRAIHSGSHAAQMIKGMTSGKEGLPPIYVMSNFFAHTISSSGDIEIIWPEDGAMVMPFYYMVKTDKAEELKELTDFLTSPQVGQLCANAYFPSLHPHVQNKVPAGAKFKWLGWDFIRKHEIDELVKRLNDRCKASHHGNKPQTKLSPVRKDSLVAGEA